MRTMTHLNSSYLNTYFNSSFGISPSMTYAARDSHTDIAETVSKHSIRCACSYQNRDIDWNTDNASEMSWDILVQMVPSAY